jgi:hypothetical protein
MPIFCNNLPSLSFSNSLRILGVFVPWWLKNLEPPRHQDTKSFSAKYNLPRVTPIKSPEVDFHPFIFGYHQLRLMSE